MEPTENKRSVYERIGLPTRSSNPTTKLAFVVLTVIFFVTLLGFLKVVLDIRELSQDSIELTERYIGLTKNNEQLIKEIQKSRLSSCRKTYDGIKLVTETSFFRNPPLTEEQKVFRINFYKTINDLKRKCKTQVR